MAQPPAGAVPDINLPPLTLGHHMFAILTEHYAGKWALWLSPRRVRLLSTLLLRLRPHKWQLCAWHL